MIEHIKKFQEEFKAKYGVEADIDISIHDERDRVRALIIANDFTEPLNSSISISEIRTLSISGQKYKNASLGKSCDLKMNIYYDVEEESTTEPVGDTMVWK